MLRLVGTCLLWLLLGIVAGGARRLNPPIDKAERLRLREEVREMFYHGYDNYLRNAFPKDELLPLSCTGKDHPDGGWGALTAVDAMDTLQVMGNHTEFERIARWTTAHVSFDLNKTVSVFETNIRLLGGLLSAHMMAMDPDLPCFKDTARPYDRGLLRLAHDLGKRLLPAFDTPTGIPYGSVNLRYGVDPGESNVTAAATAGTLVVEFWTLSELTGDERFSRAAKAAVRGLWKHRSALNLVGAHVNIQTGQWTQKESGIGGLIDSFYEYMLKGALLTQDMEYLHIFNQAYAAATSSLKLGPWYVDVNMDNGGIVWPVFSSLQCFWPGMQALIGDLDAGAETMEAFFRMWNVHGVVPEGFNLHKEGVSQPGYPLRPELAESAMYLHVASGDPIYLEMGQQMVTSLQTLTRVECGFASIQNVLTKERADIMDSFFLAETLKYLYLLFDSDHWIRRKRYIFNTEGHPLPLRPGRPNMTAQRVHEWEAVLEAWVDDNQPDKGAATELSATEVSPRPCPDGITNAQNFSSADRFVKLTGQCIVPGFYSRVASRGMNYSLLTSDDLIRGFLPEDDSSAGAESAATATTAAAAAAAAAAQIMSLNPSSSNDGLGLPDKIAELAGQWMQQLFGQQQAAAAATASKKSDGASGSQTQDHSASIDFVQLLEFAKMKMAMNDKGEVVLGQNTPSSMQQQQQGEEAEEEKDEAQEQQQQQQREQQNDEGQEFHDHADEDVDDTNEMLELESERQWVPPAGDDGIWVERWDVRTERKFWWNTVQQRVLWTPPTGLAEALSEQASKLCGGCATRSEALAAASSGDQVRYIGQSRALSGRVGTIVGGSVSVDAILVDWEGLTDSKIATAKVDCGGPIPAEMIDRGSLKWVGCDDLELLAVDINALRDREH